MNHSEFEQFVRDNGKDILRFCRMTCGGKEAGDELYQDTMLKLLEKRNRLDVQQNIKSYALSISILLWKNKKKKYANRNRLVPMENLNPMGTEESLDFADTTGQLPEDSVLQEDEKNMIQQIVLDLPEKYRIPIQLHYSAEVPVREMAKILQVPEGTVKSRMNKAKQLIKKELEALGYDR